MSVCFAASICEKSRFAPRLAASDRIKSRRPSPCKNCEVGPWLFRKVTTSGQQERRRCHHLAAQKFPRCRNSEKKTLKASLALGPKILTDSRQAVAVGFHPFFTSSSRDDNDLRWRHCKQSAMSPKTSSSVTLTTVAFSSMQNVRFTLSQLGESRRSCCPFRRQEEMGPSRQKVCRDI